MATPEAASAIQRWDAARYAVQGGFVPQLGRGARDLLATRAGERILDLGCGDGVLSAEIAAVATVIGIDASPSQVAAARGRGIEAAVGDAEAFEFEAEFDAVFSNAALHWMTRPDAVIAGVFRALKPGGRFVAEMGGAGNISRLVGAFLEELGHGGLAPPARWPWYFPTPAEYAGKLEAASFTVRSLEYFDRPTPLPGDILDWFETFAQELLAAVPRAGRRALFDRVQARLAPVLRGADGVWQADYVRLRFRAEKP